jgi:large subunit ribosomal protein L14|tara:strand:+ start:146 stop:508 length:363 start_codon:yes stop_codon:yes gene_type:complete
MIQLNTLLSVVDNSGAKTGKCIKILGGTFTGSVGNTIVVAIQKVLANRKIKAGEVHKSLVVRQKKEIQRKDSSTLSFSTNSIILLNTKNMPVATRIFGLIPRELRRKKFMKVLSMAQGVI